MRVEIIEELATGAPFALPVLLHRLATLHTADTAPVLAVGSTTVPVTIDTGDAVGSPPAGARIEIHARDDADRFPVFRGSLHIEPQGVLASRLILTGDYDVPLGWLGALADRTIFVGAAEQSLRELVARIKDDVAASALHAASGS